jgi:Ca-activated chloride channel family protein
MNDKLLRFATAGALGCLCGAILGELFLAVTRREPPAPMPQAVCLLIDCSGSMLLSSSGPEPKGRFSGGKLQEVKQAAQGFVQRQSRPPNLIAVVGFGSQIHRAAPLSANTAQLATAVELLSDGGGTAMDVALQAAAEELRAPLSGAALPAANRTILLFTDGQPDSEPTTLAVAHACREQGIRIVAIGTGDAKTDYLAQLTGDPALVFPAADGSFADSFGKAEKVIYSNSLVGSSDAGGGQLRANLRNGGWTALIALGVSLALIGCQNLYLHRALLSRHELLLGAAGGIAAGIVGGVAGQICFTLALQLGSLPLVGGLLSWIMGPLGRILGWAILGAIVGRGLAFFVPNLQPLRAWAGGAVGGAAAAVAFLVVSWLGELPGRLLGAAVLGAFIGLMIALMEVAFRTLWLEVRYGEKEVIHVSLGAQPIRIGSDSRACTVYARGARPLALQFQVAEQQVQCLDYATETLTTMQVGAQRVVGSVTVVVRGSQHAGSLPGQQVPGQGRPVSSAGATGLSAPPPPPRRSNAGAAPKPDPSTAASPSGNDDSPKPALPTAPATPTTGMPVKRLTAPPPPKRTPRPGN